MPHKCDWYYGEHATPDLTKCPRCPDKSYCVGRKYMLKATQKNTKRDKTEDDKLEDILIEFVKKGANACEDSDVIRGRELLDKCMRDLKSHFRKEIEKRRLISRDYTVTTEILDEVLGRGEK